MRTLDRDGRPHPRPDKTGPSELVTGRGRFGFADGTLILVETFAPFTRADALDGIPFEVDTDAAFREGVELPMETLALAEALSG